MKIKQRDIYLVKHNPSISGIKKTRPSIVIQNNFLNSVLDTIVVIPLSSKLDHPSRAFDISIEGNGLKSVSFALVPSIGSVSKSRFVKKIGTISSDKFGEIIKSISYLF